MSESSSVHFLTKPFTLKVKCVALKSASQNRSDPSIKRGVKWLLNSIGKQYDSISERVRADVMEQRQTEAQQRKERAERVRKIREERERYLLMSTFYSMSQYCILSWLMQTETVERRGR